MKFIEIEQYFNDESLVLEIIQEYTDCFNEINELNRQMRAFEAKTPDQIDEVLTRFTGLYGTLNEVLGQAEYEKNNRQVRYLEQLKSENSNKPVKEQENITSLKNEASAQVAPYRKVRNIFASYVETCKVTIVTCQSRLKRVVTEMQHLKQYNTRKMDNTNS